MIAETMDNKQGSLVSTARARLLFCAEKETELLKLRSKSVCLGHWASKVPK